MSLQQVAGYFRFLEQRYRIQAVRHPIVFQDAMQEVTFFKRTSGSEREPCGQKRVRPSFKKVRRLKKKEGHVAVGRMSHHPTQKLGGASQLASSYPILPHPLSQQTLFYFVGEESILREPK